MALDIKIRYAKDEKSWECRESKWLILLHSSYLSLSSFYVILISHVCFSGSEMKILKTFYSSQEINVFLPFFSWNIKIHKLSSQKNPNDVWVGKGLKLTKSGNRFEIKYENEMEEKGILTTETQLQNCISSTPSRP